MTFDADQAEPDDPTLNIVATVGCKRNSVQEVALPPIGGE
jgi:hypothetical protein